MQAGLQGTLKTFLHRSQHKFFELIIKKILVHLVWNRLIMLNAGMGSGPRGRPQSPIPSSPPESRTRPRRGVARARAFARRRALLQCACAGNQLVYDYDSVGAKQHCRTRKVTCHT